jgi:hypothetical protein
MTSVVEDAGFNPSLVDRMEVIIHGSGGIDNLAFVPEPTALAWIGILVVAAGIRRRRSA